MEILNVSYVLSRLKLFIFLDFRPKIELSQIMWELAKSFVRFVKLRLPAETWSVSETDNVENVVSQSDVCYVMLYVIPCPTLPRAKTLPHVVTVKW